MTNEILDDFTDEEITKVPTGLIVLSILTFIWNGLIIIGIIAGGLMAFNLTNSAGAAMPSGAILAFALIIALCIINVIGAAKMLKLKKSGYWMYLISNIIYIVFFTIGTISMSQVPRNGINSQDLTPSIFMIVFLTVALVVMTIIFSSYYKKFK